MEEGSDVFGGRGFRPVGGGGAGRVGQIQVTSPKSWEKAFYVPPAFVTEDGLSSAQRPAALL